MKLSRDTCRISNCLNACINYRVLQLNTMPLWKACKISIKTLINALSTCIKIANPITLMFGCLHLIFISLSFECSMKISYSCSWINLPAHYESHLSFILIYFNMFNATCNKFRYRWNVFLMRIDKLFKSLQVS